MHIHPAKALITNSIMMLMSVYLILGSMWIIFGVVLEPIVIGNHPGFGILLASLSIVWSAVSLIIAVYFISQVRGIIKRSKHARKT